METSTNCRTAVSNEIATAFGDEDGVVVVRLDCTAYDDLSEGMAAHCHD